MPETNQSLFMKSMESLNLSAFVHILRHHKALIGSLAVTSLLLSTLYVFGINPEWEATALVRVGQVAAISGCGGHLVEPPQQVVERVMQESFEDSVLSELGIALDSSDGEGKLYRAKLGARLVSGTDAFEVKLRGHSSKQARQFIAATVGQIKRVHHKLYNPSIQHMRSQIVEISRDIESAVNERMATLRSITESNARTESGDGFSQVALVSYVVSSRDSDILELKRRKSDIEEALSPLRTYPTSIVSAVSLSKKPVYPKKSLTIVVGGMTGLLAGILVALLLDSRRRDSTS